MPQHRPIMSGSISAEPRTIFLARRRGSMTVDQSLRGELLARIEEAQPAIQQLATRLIAIPTENPPGHALQQCAAVIVEALQELQLQPTTIEVPVDGPGDRRVSLTAGF